MTQVRYCYNERDKGSGRDTDRETNFIDKNETVRERRKEGDVHGEEA